MPHRSLSTAIATALLLQGCADNVIRSDFAGACEDRAATCSHKVPLGVAYWLPKGQVLLVASRKQISDGDVAKAQSTLADAYQSVADATTKLASAQAMQLKNTTPNEPDSQKAQDASAVAAAKATLSSAQSAQVAAQQNLDALTAGKGKYVESFSLTPLPVIPDGQRQFFADLVHFKYRDDTLKLGISNGLLTTSGTQSSDQSLNILSNLMSAATGIVTFAGAGLPLVPKPAVAAPAAAPKPPPPPASSCEYEYSAVFDPVNREEVKEVRDNLTQQNGGANFDLDSSLLSQPVESSNNEAPPKGKFVNQGHVSLSRNGTGERAEPIDGLVYRTAVATQLTVTPKKNALTIGCPLQTLPLPQSVQVIVPDTRSEFIVPALAGGGTASNLSFGFSSGMLTDYNVVRPSEYAAIASLPVDVINKIMTIPTSILKLRLDYSTAETNLATQQAALVTAQSQQALALVNAKTALQTAETNLAVADLNDPAARYKALTAIIQARQALQDAIAAASKPPSATAQ